MADFKDNINIDATITLAGFLGSIISLKYAKNTTTIGSALSVLGGGFTAMFATPFIGEHVAFLNTANGQALTSFILGLFGLNFVAWCYEYLDKNGWLNVLSGVFKSRNKQ